MSDGLLLLEQPPLPETLVCLTSEQASRVNLTQGRKWTSTETECLTCGKANDCTYKWYTPDAGIGRVDSMDHFAIYRCRCEDQYRLFRWMSWAGLGLNSQRTDWFDSIDLLGTQAQEDMLNYTRNASLHVSSGMNLILWAKETGTGKTFMASMLAKRLLLLGFDVFFSTLDSALTLYTSSWRSDAERAHFDDRVRTATVLVIDDIGREHPGRADVVISMLDSVLRFRIANCLPTVITTNLPPDQLTAYGQNIISLLRERMLEIEVTGRDKRELITQRTLREHSLRLTRPIVVV